MKTKITVLIVIVLVVAGIIIVATNNKSSTSTNTLPGDGASAGIETLNPNATSTGTTASTTGTTGATTYTLAVVATHNSKTSCWTTINGGVYDVTSWISQHPGGPDRILSLCGIDGSSAFNNQHSGQARPEQELASFKIGTLAK